MTEKRDVIMRLRLGHSIRQISRDTGMHRTIIRRLYQAAVKQGWLESSGTVPAEKTIQNTITCVFDTDTESGHILDAYHDRIKGWLEEKDSYVVIHQMLSQEVAVSESTVRRYCQKTFPEAPKAVYLRPTIPGAIMEVDFGTFGMIYDEREKRNRRGYVFSARLRHSRYAYRECVLSQDQSTFFRCHVHAFEYFGGVPEQVVPDNLKAAVIKASFTDPQVNRLYHKLAEHYGFVIDPCPPYSPNLKGGVENDIKYIKRNFWPQYRESERQKGCDVPGREGLQKALEAWSEHTAHRRIISGIGARPIDLFEQEEKDCLQPLPYERWREVSMTSAKVQETWRVQVDRAYYSVPYRYIGQKVCVFISDEQVEIYKDYDLIATHRRATRAWEAVLDAAHNPPNVAAFLSSTREGLLQRAAHIGPHVTSVIQYLLNQKTVNGVKPSRAILALRKTYGPSRLDSACERALLFENIQYSTIKRILTHRLDMVYQYEAIDSAGNFCFLFTRPRGYFGGETPQVQEVFQ